MLLRLMFGMLASALPNHHNSEMEDPEKVILSSPEEWKHVSHLEPGEGDLPATFINYYDGAAKFHIGMLTISLIVGLAYGGYVGYTCWQEKDVFLGYIRNLVIALVCRTFFTILFDGVVLLGTPTSAGGANTLTAFEQICLNLVLAFWLSLTVYAHARVQRNFKSEPTLMLYQYGIPAVSAFFAFVWIFTMQDVHPTFIWWLDITRFHPWIVNSANLLFLFIQLGLVGDMCRMMIPIKNSLDNDSLSLLWRVAAMMGTLVFLFWLQFGLSLGPYKTQQSQLYFFFFIDGIECALVCVCFYLFHKWVSLLCNKSRLSFGSEETQTTAATVEATEYLPGGRGIVTVDSIFVSQESGRWKNSQEEDSKDVVYSNVIEPHRLQKTLELYKRLNVIPNQVTVVEGEEFFDCQVPVQQETVNHLLPLAPTPKEYNFRLKKETMLEPTQKKNAFYASKYLILDSKESEFPKYLETRPSVSSASEKDSLKERQTVKPDPFASLEVGELVRKWLNDNSENMPKNRNTSPIEKKELSRENSDVETPKPVSETAETEQQGKAILEEDKNVIPVPEVITNRPEELEQNTKNAENKILQDDQTKVSINLNTENDKAPRSSEIPTNIENINEITDRPRGSVPSEPVNASKPAPKQEAPSESVAAAPTPTIMSEPATAKDKSPSPFLTYSELLEFRSKRDGSEEPVKNQSLSENIFSKLDLLISASGSLLSSLTGFAQAKQAAGIEGTDDRLPKYDKPEELHEQSKTEKIKQVSANYDRFPRQSQPEYEEQAKVQRIQDLRYEEPKPHSDLTLPERSTVEQPDDVAVHPDESITKRESMLENDKQMPEFKEQSSKGVWKEPLKKKTEEKVKPIEKQDIAGLSPDHSTIERQSKTLKNEIQKDKLENRIQMPIYEEQSFKGAWDKPLKKRTEDKVKPIEKQDIAGLSPDHSTPENKIKSNNLKNRIEIPNLEQQSLIADRNQLLQKPIKDTESVGTSSDSEFSIERVQLFSSERSIKPVPKQRAMDAAETQSTASKTSEVTTERKPSSLSSSESDFSLENYYTQVLSARTKLENQPSPIQVNRKRQ